MRGAPEGGYDWGCGTGMGWDGLGWAARKVGVVWAVRASLPPTIMLRLPLAAPSGPPETGASRKETPAAAEAACSSRANSTLTVPASMSNEPGAATSSSPPGSRKTDRSAASPATETTTVEARLHSSSRLHGRVKG